MTCDRNTSFSTMLLAVLAVGLILTPLAKASGDGNLHLLKEEIAEALKTCSDTEIKAHSRPKREDGSKIDSSGNSPSIIDAIYEHVRRNTTTETQFNVQNDTGTAEGLALAGGEQQLVNAPPEETSRQRVKRSNTLTNKQGADECLSQCVFANMQVVDARGIPREPELWARVQNSVTSQQSRMALRDQLRSCFQEMESEAEDDGCSYSNKLERCLTLHLSERSNINATATERN